MCSAVLVRLYLLVVVGNAAAGTVREKRCPISFPTPDDSIRRVTLPDFTNNSMYVWHTSQQFSQTYSGPLILEWTISHYSLIALTLDNVTLSDSPDCQDEYLELRTVKANESLMVLRTCGVREINFTVFYDSAVNFKLYLQDAQNDHGVSFIYTMRKTEDLMVHPEKSGEILSANYPTIQNPIGGILHSISVTPFHPIKLTINDFDISNTTCFATMSVTVAYYNNKDDQVAVCIEDQDSIISPTNLMLIHVIGSATNHTGRGFNFTYEELPTVEVP